MKTSRYAESGYLSATSKLSPSGSAAEANDSQLSLTSSSNSLYSSVHIFCSINVLNDLTHPTFTFPFYPITLSSMKKEINLIASYFYFVLNRKNDLSR